MGDGLELTYDRSSGGLERNVGKDAAAGMAQANQEHGYRLHEITACLGVLYMTVSRRVKQIERVAEDVRGKVLMTFF